MSYLRDRGKVVMETEVIEEAKPVKRLMQQVQKILEEKGLPSTWPDVLTILGKLEVDKLPEEKKSSLVWPNIDRCLKNAELDEESINAAELYVRAHIILEQMEKSNEARDAVYNTMLMMGAAQNINFLGWLPDIKRGAKVIKSSKCGHEKVHGTQEEKNERWSKFQADIDELHKERPEIKSYNQICQWVADRHGVTVRTIQNHTKNPLKK